MKLLPCQQYEVLLDVSLISESSVAAIALLVYHVLIRENLEISQSP